MKLIYFHGFGSSAQSGTIRTLRRMLSDFEVIAPDIPVDPADALPFLKQLCEDEQPDVVIGTSMGGMYAQQMFGFNRICVNPAFEMSTMSKVLKVGTFEYFNPRMAPSAIFLLAESYGTAARALGNLDMSDDSFHPRCSLACSVSHWSPSDGIVVC